MTDEKFDKRMEDWVDVEAEASPELRPTAEMYRLVESRGGWIRKFWTQPRWAVAGAAVAALVLLIAGGLVLGDPSAWLRPGTVQQIAFIEQRPGPDALPETPKNGKGPEKECFQQLTLQVHREASREIETYDPRDLHIKPITLTASDDFRMLIQPFQPRNIYIYMVSPNEDYLALHLETEFNPLHPLQTTILPAPPNWFYLSGKSGAYRLLLITAPHAIPELDRLYNNYRHQPAGTDFESAHSALSEYLESITLKDTGDIEVWEMILDLQD